MVASLALVSPSTKAIIQYFVSSCTFCKALPRLQNSSLTSLARGQICFAFVSHLSLHYLVEQHSLFSCDAAFGIVLP